MYLYIYKYEHNVVQKNNNVGMKTIHAYDMYLLVADIHVMVCPISLPGLLIFLIAMMSYNFPLFSDNWRPFV